jgi:hypothetical protein
MFEAYRVNKRFAWDGWILAPVAGTHTSTFEEIEGLTPSEQAANFKQQGCWDERAVNPELYGGDIWIVPAGHPRKDAILSRNKARGDASIASPDDLLNDDQYKRLLAPPQMAARV